MSIEAKQAMARMRAMLADYVQQGTVPGAVTAVQYGDDTHIDAVGATAYEEGVELRPDAIFRIASLTKPITAVATLILAEECKLRLHDPVDEFLPELANRQVLVRPDAPLDATVPANRPITTYDLLTSRNGIGMVLDSPELPILAEIERREIAGFVPGIGLGNQGPKEWLASLGELPLIAQPGERWLYGTSFTMLGVLVERVAGVPLETFLAERILRPLGMVDTGFSVPEAERHRLVTAYLPDKRPGYVFEDPGDGPPVLPDASGGLVSTVGDYLRFARMLRNNGTYDGVRILSRPSVQAMVTNQLTDEQRAGGAPILDPNRGWGLGVSVTCERDRMDAVPGRYGWEGGSGTSWANDPSEGLTGIIFTQRIFAEDSMRVYSDFWTSVYRALG